MIDLEIQKYGKGILLLTILLIISLYLFFTYNEKSTNQEVPKRATFVMNSLGDRTYYG